MTTFTTLHKLLRSLSERRPIFHSEADFQHELAWQIRLAADASATLRLEQPVGARRSHLDLLFKQGACHVAFELKYKTKAASIRCNGEDFCLRDQRAQDTGRYDFLKDIERIERYVDEHAGAEGYVVLLTNDPSYWQVRQSTAADAAFRIHEGRVVEGVLEWGSQAADGTKHKRDLHLSIARRYTMAWHDYSKIDRHDFRCVVVHVRANEAAAVSSAAQNEKCGGNQPTNL